MVKMSHSDAGRIGGRIAGKILREISIKEYYKNPNICNGCGKIIEIREGQQVAFVRKKKYCTHKCAGILITKRKKEYKCLCCNNILGKGKSKFCNVFCQHKYNYNNFIKEWLSGNKIYNKLYMSEMIRKYLLNKYNYSCQICGWNQKNTFTDKCYLEIHHKDGNPTNNIESNLQVLCPNCHSLTSNYKNIDKQRLNNGNRLYRRKNLEFKCNS